MSPNRRQAYPAPRSPNVAGFLQGSTRPAVTSRRLNRYIPAAAPLIRVWSRFYSSLGLFRFRFWRSSRHGVYHRAIPKAVMIVICIVVRLLVTFAHPSREHPRFLPIFKSPLHAANDGVVGAIDVAVGCGLRSTQTRSWCRASTSGTTPRSVRGSPCATCRTG